MASDNDFPRFWDWDVDGPDINGTFVGLTEIPTKRFGLKPAVVLHIGKEDRTVPLWDTAIRNRFSDEVARRKDGELADGEQVVIRRGAVVEGGNGYSYRSYRVGFPEAPRRSAKDILGPSLDEGPVSYEDEPQPPEPEGGDDVPY